MKAKKQKCAKRQTSISVDDADVNLQFIWQNVFVRHYLKRHPQTKPDELEFWLKIYQTAAMGTLSWLMRIWEDPLRLRVTFNEHRPFDFESQNSPVHDLWRKFRDEALDGVDPNLIVEIKKVFFLGAHVVLTKIILAASQGGKACATALDSLNDEVGKLGVK